MSRSKASGISGSRRAFLRTTMCAAAAPWVIRTRAAWAEARRIRYAGWQVGLTYQSGRPAGLDRDYLMRLLDEMARQRMNLLSLMMLSYAYYDPDHDGYAWPVRNSALRCYQDTACVNGRTETEFVAEIIQAAADRKIEVQLFMNWGIWNPEKIRQSYPTAGTQYTRDNEPGGWLHCPDAPGTWQAGLDEARDLLEVYKHPNVKSYSFERISYQSRNYCYCPHTRERFQKDTGEDIAKAKEKRIEVWKNEHIGGLLAEYIRKLCEIRPGLDIGLHTQCAAGWGHDPARLKEYGVDALYPHTIQFQETERSLHALMARLAPNPCVLHFCARDQRPANYKLWIKTPEIIAEALEWIARYPGDNLAGLLFFNEPAVSAENKRAVYENLKRFSWG